MDSDLPIPISSARTPPPVSGGRSVDSAFVMTWRNLDPKGVRWCLSSCKFSTTYPAPPFNSAGRHKENSCGTGPNSRCIIKSKASSWCLTTFSPRGSTGAATRSRQQRRPWRSISIASPSSNGVFVKGGARRLTCNRELILT